MFGWRVERWDGGVKCRSDCKQKLRMMQSATCFYKHHTIPAYDLRHKVPRIRRNSPEHEQRYRRNVQNHIR